MDRHEDVNRDGLAIVEGSGIRALVVAIVVGMVMCLALQVANILPDVDATLVEMGFDPDRARLISSLTVGSLVAAIATLCGGGRIAPVFVGMAVFGAFDASAFWTETSNALSSGGSAGRFSPAGWLLTVATLFFSALAFCWAASLIAHSIGRALEPAGSALRDLAARRRPTGRSIGGIVVTGGAIVLAVIVATTFGDLVNFSPDAHMLTGGPAQVGLFTGPTAGGPGAVSGQPGTGGGQGGSGPAADAIPVPLPSVSLPPGYRMVPGPLAGSIVTEGVLSASAPWSARPPKGQGRVVSTTLPPPWTGGTKTAAAVDVYLPPGYPQAGMRYPVVYVTPYQISHWNSSMQLQSVLDSLVTSGAFPPEIFVFAATGGGPYVDSECANSWDGREWFDRYMATTLVAYIDSTYATIPTVEARALLGYSQGGYCSAALLFRHPDVFGSAISLSGYYEAGLASRETTNAWMPFNRDPALMAAASPLSLAATIPQAVRSRMLMIMSADPAAVPFGSQMTAFTGVLESNGVPAAVFPVTNAHAWPVVRSTLLTVLPMLAERQVQLGVPFP